MKIFLSSIWILTKIIFLLKKYQSRVPRFFTKVPFYQNVLKFNCIIYILSDYYS